jgi:hypothetical protein
MTNPVGGPQFADLAATTTGVASRKIDTLERNARLKNKFHAILDGLFRLFSSVRNAGRALSNGPMRLQTRLLRMVDAAAGAFGVLNRPLSADDLIALARRRTGLEEFGDLGFSEPMRRFLKACDEEAELSLVGRVATQWDVVRFLSNLLHLRAAEAQASQIVHQPIQRPIFIAGLPRSGTTFLHRLLMQDSANRSPLVWETIYPYASAQHEGANRDRRAEMVRRQLWTFEKLAPEFRALHPLEADSPQECSDITAHVFRSLRFDTNYNIPSYRTWLDSEGHLEAYRFHRRFLQHLQHQGGKREGTSCWVLKCPDHLFALNAIRLVYPDARMVFVHRDPLRVLLSVAKLTEVLRAPFSRRIDRVAIGRQESTRYVAATEVMIEASRVNGFAEPILDVRHTDLIANPLAAVQMLYRHFGLELRQEAAARIRAYAEEQPDGGYGPRTYRFEDHGLDPQAERARFARYMDWFGIEVEAVAPRHAGRLAPA